MGKIAYLDCFSGISGDMVLGAFVDCGLEISQLKKEISKLKIGDFDIKAKKVKRGHISGTKINIFARGKTRLSRLQGIIKLIDTSKIAPGPKRIAKDIFTNLAKAEAKVHNQSLNSVHFHQLGELDTVIDILGTAIAIEYFGLKKIYSSGITLGTGTVNFQGRVLPLPAPATVELIKKRTVSINSQIKYEMVTPTGAAILSTISKEKLESLPMRINKVGYGAGTYNDPMRPNLLRIIIADSGDRYATDTVNIVEANLDDMLALNFELLFERLFRSGALDVYTTAIMMKKLRPGTLLSVQVPDENLDTILAIIFEETTSLGVRINKVARRKLARKVLNLKTDYGIIVKVKIGIMDSKIVNIAPEYDDCKKIAQQKNLPFKMVYDRIKAQAFRKFT